MAPHQTHETLDDEMALARRDILRGICRKPETWYYDQCLASLASCWRQILRAAAELEDRPAPDKPEFDRPEFDPPDIDSAYYDKPDPARRKYDKPYPSGQFTELFLLVDVLHHWMHHQNLYRKRQQEPVFREFLPTRQDLAPHIGLVRSTIASLALNDFGSWLEYMTKEGPETPDSHLLASFVLDYSPAGYTLRWKNWKGEYYGQPKINLSPLFPGGRPRYVNPRMYSLIKVNKDDDKTRVALSWWAMDTDLGLISHQEQDQHSDDYPSEEEQLEEQEQGANSHMLTDDEYPTRDKVNAYDPWDDCDIAYSYAPSD
ncbi:hypothetical protein SLS62_001034 [Diatrype stigma]|uniref:Uncharacterized protein n=1 Tax=Diatrype stigma TaxID=117547 RepID=A0AAN9UZ67_9PEZI